MRLMSRKLKQSKNFANQHYKWETQFKKNGKGNKLNIHREENSNNQQIYKEMLNFISN